MQFLERKIINAARKEHRCNYCFGIIEIGTSYFRDRMAVDGEAYTWKAHQECTNLAHRYDNAVGCGDEGIPEMSEWEPEYLSAEDQTAFKRIIQH